MKKIVLIFIMIMGCYGSNAQAWLWGRCAVDKVQALSEGESIAADNEGNVYVLGMYSDTISFGNITLLPFGDPFCCEYMCLVKYDQNGNVLWAKRAGQAGSTVLGLDLACDLMGNVYVTGGMAGDSIEFDFLHFSVPNNFHVFVAKYNSSGIIEWVNVTPQLNTGFATYGISITTDEGGNPLVTGSFGAAEIYFGPDTLTDYNNTDQYFLAKYDPSGNTIWGRTAQQEDYSVGTGVACDKSSNIYVTGNFDLANFILDDDTLTSMGSTDMFVGKYDQNGNVIWARAIAGNLTVQSYCISVDPEGNTYVTGNYKGDTLHFANDMLPDFDGYEAYLVKYDPQGSEVWARGGLGTNDEVGTNCVCDHAGNIYASGTFEYPGITFSGITMNVSPLGWPLYLLKYDPEGNIICNTFISDGGDDANGLALGLGGDVYISSDFAINPMYVGPDILTRTGTEDIFVAKYSCDFSGIQQALTQLLITYPNPVENELIINLPGATAGVTVRVYDAEARRIYLPEHFSNQALQLDTSQLPCGFYTVQIINTITGVSAVAKFIK